MNGEIILTQPAVYGVLCLLAAVVIAGILYWGDRDATRPYRGLLAALRGAAVGILAFLLLGPLLRSIDTRTQRPVFVVARDVSSSAMSSDAPGDADIDNLVRELGEQYDVVEVNFGSSVRPTSNADTSRDAATDISALFDYAADQFAPELLGGVLLTSDGIYNQGIDPSYAAAKLAAPVYTVGLGDTTPTRDVAIREVLSNRIAYLGDRLQLQVDLQAVNFSGGSSTVTLSRVGAGGRLQQLASERVAFERKREFRTVAFEVEPTRAGVIQYRVRASGPRDERNVVNNARDVYVDVLDARQRVLLLASAPHPDVSAIRQALDGNRNYEVEFALASEFDGDVSEVDLAILHNLPSSRFSLTELGAALDRRRAGRLYIAGPPTDLQALSTSQGLLSVTPKGGEGNAVTPQLNAAFRLFTIPAAWTQSLQNFPPVLAPYADYGALTSGDALLSQRVGRVATDFPLLAMGEVNGMKVGVFTAQDLWRWRLAEYQRTESHEVFDGLLTATVQYLALREDKRPFRVVSAEKVYTTSDGISLQGELYNASYQLVNEPDVQVRVSAEDGANYDFVMDKTGNAYQLRAGRLPAGRYSFRASTQYDGEAFTSEGGFTIREVQLEATNTTADWALLQRIARQQGGEFVPASELAGLSAKLVGTSAAKPVLYQSVRTRPLIDWPWLLAIVLALLGIEWFVRRRVGTY